MDNQFIVKKVTDFFPAGITGVDETSDILTIQVSREIIHDVIRFLRDEEALAFTFLTDLCGVHYPEQSLPLGIVYHLQNMEKNTRLRIKTFVKVDEPKVSTITDLFSGANWMERETYDFYGIIFEGHPNLIRILNVEYLDYFPMRKEYPLEDATREDKDDRFFGR